MTLRVAFTLIDKSRWAGGYQYQINLFRIWREYGDPRIRPVLFAGQDVVEGDIKPFHSLIDDGIVVSPVFDPKRKTRRLIDTLISGADRSAEKIFQRNRIDVIFGSAVYYGRSFGIPSIAWIPDFQHRQLPELFGRFAYWKRELGFRAQISSGMTVMVSSESAKRDCEKYYPFVKRSICVVPFAVLIPQEALTVDPQEARLRYQLPSDYFYLPNQFWKHKNHETVIEALRLLKEQGKEVVVATSGQPHDPRHPGLYDHLQAAVRTYRLEKNFIFLGMIPYMDVLGLMRAAVAVINPSVMEGWSTTVEEAKSLGLPLILSDIPVHREQASPFADFFDPRSPASLAHTLDHFLNQMINKACQYQKEAIKNDATRRVQFYAQRFAEAIVDAYNSRKAS